MHEKGHFLFIGSGGSMGIPVIGCHCAVCQSESSKNHRMRPSGLITINNKKLLIDCGPDFHWQALQYHIDNLDGLLLTHAHHDHIAGLDELRVYYMHSKQPLNCLLSKQTSAEVMARYAYMFVDEDLRERLTPRMVFQLLEKTHGETIFQGIPIQYMTYEQAGMLVNGFRFRNFAYLSDIHLYTDTIFDHLKGVETLVISALRFTPSPFHLSVDEAINFAQRTGARQTWLTHISHDLDHDRTNAYLPSNIRMAYDGLELTF